MFSKFFIERPIFATILAILMIIVGLVTVKSLPVAQFPDITPPTVQVSTTYPGADAETVAKVVGVPIEEQVNGVEGMMYMSSSSSSDGSYSLTVTFEVGTDLDMATVKVQNRIALAESSLPSPVKQQGISVKSQSTNIVLFVAIESDNPTLYDALYLTNYAKLNLVDEISRIDGVGGCDAFGAGEYSMRIWLDPEKMRIRGLTPADISSLITSQNMEVSAGSVGAPPSGTNDAFQLTVTSQGRLTTVDEFENIAIKVTDDGSILRLRDIATVDLGSQTYNQVSRVSGNEAGLMGIYQLPGANALDVAKRVETRLAELAQYFPTGVNYRIIMNTTEFVSASIDEVLVTFLETTLIVMSVILLFLQNWRAVIIPMLTIPVSLIATFAVMKLLGFTINTLTLFGLVLAIAIVVDDAIVVVEDCARIVDEGKLTPRQAAEKAMKELQGPVIGVALVLMAVFIPTAFISGITGELYKQFALTIAVSTAFSAFNALTFTPAMCALFLTPRRPATFILYRWFNRVFSGSLNGYTRLIDRMLRHPMLSLVVFIGICFLAFWGFSRWRTSYIPEEDMGYFMTSVQLPSGASLQRTDSIVNHLSRQIKQIPEVKDVISVSGTSFIGGGAGSNVGSIFVILEPWKDRKTPGTSAEDIIAKVNAISANIQEAIVFSINPPAIQGLGMSSGLQMQLLDINNLGANQLALALGEIQRTAAEDKRIASVTSLFEGTVPQYSLKIDRDKAKLEGLTISDIYSALSSYMGGTYVNDFVDFGRIYEVKIAAHASARAHADDIMKLCVRNKQSQMVPFASFATIEPAMGESTVSRYNMYNTASLTATPAAGVSSSEGIEAMREIVDKAVGDNFGYAWTGEAYQETQAGTTVSIVLLFAVIITILVLAAQYESWTNPLAVVITMPTAILGTIIGCIVMNQSISIYTQIGIILLLGLSAKNAILIVEYAIDFRKVGVPLRQAALDAGRIRFRPIIMTALAFIFGIMPMLFASGAGAASRLSLGTAVVFGMTVNAIVGTLFVPNFWELLQSFQEKYLSGLFSTADRRNNNIDTNITTPRTGPGSKI
jgi:hydrophobe/amphiphile efflux-1 (HAE1) family protein